MKLFGLAGWSGAGKTTLVVRLLPALAARGLTVSTMKHAHHSFDIDQPGKDSFRHRAAGATEVALVTGARYAIVHEMGREQEATTLDEVLARLAPADLVLVEGFKRDAFPKLEIHRAANGKPLIQPDDPHIVAIASDIPLPQAKVPVVGLDDIETIADVLLQHAAPIRSVAAAMRGA
jgi:molybdopterin-guanine dinucleotide biosynthesis protein B